MSEEDGEILVAPMAVGTPVQEVARQPVGSRPVVERAAMRVPAVRAVVAGHGHVGGCLDDVMQQARQAHGHAPARLEALSLERRATADEHHPSAARAAQ